MSSVHSVTLIVDFTQSGYSKKRDVVVKMLCIMSKKQDDEVFTFLTQHVYLPTFNVTA